MPIIFTGKVWKTGASAVGVKLALYFLTIPKIHLIFCVNKWARARDDSQGRVGVRASATNGRQFLMRFL